MPRGIILQEAHYTPCRKLRYFTLTDDECFLWRFQTFFLFFPRFESYLTFQNFSSTFFLTSMGAIIPVAKWVWVPEPSGLAREQTDISVVWSAARARRLVPEWTECEACAWSAAAEGDTPSPTPSAGDHFRCRHLWSAPDLSRAPPTSLSAWKTCDGTGLNRTATQRVRSTMRLRV